MCTGYNLYTFVQVIICTLTCTNWFECEKYRLFVQVNMSLYRLMYTLKRFVQVKVQVITCTKLVQVRV
jgi:hypothetical protein